MEVENVENSADDAMQNENEFSEDFFSPDFEKFVKIWLEMKKIIAIYDILLKILFFLFILNSGWPNSDQPPPQQQQQQAPPAILPQQQQQQYQTHQTPSLSLTNNWGNCA